MNLKSELNKKKESIVSYQKNILKNPKKKWTFIIGFVIVLLLILVYLNLGIFLAATVNGQPITRPQLQDSLKLKIQVEKLIADKISISEEEITTYFNENNTSFVENAKLED